MDQEADNTEQQPKLEYTVGDLLWVKVGSFPYWPCMVSYEPFEGIFFKTAKTLHGGLAISYHVQYFGKQVERGWTTPGLIMPYEGKDAYWAKRDEAKYAAKTAKALKRAVAKYGIPHSHKIPWAIAVEEIEEASKLDIEDRFENFVFRYTFDIPRKNASTKKGKENSNVILKGKEPNAVLEQKMKATKKIEFYNADKRYCKICGESNVDILCAGSCRHYYHTDCVGMVIRPEIFRCIPCQKSIHFCFICKKPGLTSFVCSKCKHPYHEECVAKFPFVDMVKKICPSHVCLTCSNKNLKSKAKASLLSCIKCPTSFHSSQDCLPVGTVKLSPGAICCPDHLTGKDKESPQPNCNVSYCSVCSEGGQLVCCEFCPHSYHTKCINVDEVPKGDFYCDDCTKRQFLYVGMIIWAKTGNFRWWPGQIMDPDTVPKNVQNMEYFLGEFLVQYFGTDEYFWTHRGRVIPYLEHHKEFFHRRSKHGRLDSYFSASIEEASEAYDNYKNRQKLSNIANERNSYKHIKVNRAVPPAHIANIMGELDVLPCACNPKKPFPCGETSGCLNRSMLMECQPSVCLAGDRCENQKFQRREYAKVNVILTENRGWGLQADEFINKGSFVIEYVGEIITHEEYKKRVKKMQENNVDNYYFLYLDSRRMIDAGPRGNLARFINHACTANCEMSKWSVNGDSRIGIFALRDIEPGEELTFNYQFDSLQFEQICYCGTQGCQGIIGKKAVDKERKKLKAKRRLV